MTVQIPRRLGRKSIYQSPWVNLFVDRVQFPNGHIVEEHHLLDFEHQAVMAAAQDEAGRWLMVKVPRYATGRADWEFPAGRIEAGEDVLAAAQRELSEETGYDSIDHELVHFYYPMVGISNQVHHIVRCRVIGQAGNYDQNEISAVGWFSEGEIRRMIRAHEITGGYTMLAFLLCQGLS